MKLALLDLDNTLVDSQYNLTSPENELRSLVDDLEKKDIRIGLCSDSAIITLRQWSNRLGFTGPIIAEGGAVIGDPVRNFEDVLDTNATGWFGKFRQMFVIEIMRNFPAATVIVGDATRFVMDHMLNIATTPQVFVVNGFRAASFSLFTCCPSLDRTSLVPDPRLLIRASNIAEEVLKSFGKSKDTLFWDENHKYGVLIIRAAITERRRSVSILIDQLKPEKTVMIGDDMSDFFDLPDVVQYAVGNAEPSYKAKSAFVASRPLTEGVIECLRQL